MSNLQEAFREAARREFAAVPDETELDYVFSRKFERRMRRIIRAQVHGYWHMVNTLGKRIAIAAAILVMLLTSVMAIKPIRERVIKFFIEVYEDYFEITFGSNTSGDLDPAPKDMPKYTFSKLPHGYSETKHISSDSLCWTIWHNNSGFQITLHQEPGTQNIIVDDNFSLYDEIQHNEITLKRYLYSDSTCYIWTQDEHTFLLTVQEEFGLRDILVLIDSLHKIT